MTIETNNDTKNAEAANVKLREWLSALQWSYCWHVCKAPNAHAYPDNHHPLCIGARALLSGETKP